MLPSSPSTTPSTTMRTQSSLTISSEEIWAAKYRILQDAYNRLVIGPGYAFLMGCSAVFTVACYEGYLHLDNCGTGNIASASSTVTTTPFSSSLSKIHFVIRYGLAQIIPSLIWGQQPAWAIAKIHNIRNVPLLQHNQLSSHRLVGINYMVAIRGAIAGTIVLSQVVSFTNVMNDAKDAYSQRIKLGKESPLTITHQKKSSKDDGVIIRLAGKTSDVTSLTFQRQGRQAIFPIYEEPQFIEQSIVSKYATCTSNNTNGSSLSRYMIPIYWHVQDKQYGYPESWSGLSIPQSWLFSMKSISNSGEPKTALKHSKNPLKKKKMLILEADAIREETGMFTSTTAVGKGTKSSATVPVPSFAADTLDLDLYEVAQGFYQIERLLANNETTSKRHISNQDHETLCVLLVDANSQIQLGGGHAMTVRDYVSSLGLADIIIDSQKPIILALQKWLQQHKLQNKCNEESVTGTWTRLMTYFQRNHRQRSCVILETPDEIWYETIQSILANLGYTVINRTTAIQKCGTICNIPILVYEKTTQDTIHTIRRLIEQNIALPQDICALCPTHRGLMETRRQKGDEVSSKGTTNASSSAVTATEIANICSSDIHDRLFRNVRYAALNGTPKQEIQNRLDKNMESFLEEQNENDYRSCIQL